MAKTGQGSRVGGLNSIVTALPPRKPRIAACRAVGSRFCGDIDMKIEADGTWLYQKTPIGRPALVKLFSGILKREGDQYFLVTRSRRSG